MLDRTEKIKIAMFAVVVVAVAVSATSPHSFAVWMTEIFWVAGLLVILLVTRRMFRFSLAAYACFFVWMMLQTVGAHYTFELVPIALQGRTLLYMLYCICLIPWGLCRVPRGEIPEQKTDAYISGVWYTIARNQMKYNSTGKQITFENLAVNKGSELIDAVELIQ